MYYVSSQLAQSLTCFQAKSIQLVCIKWQIIHYIILEIFVGLYGTLDFTHYPVLPNDLFICGGTFHATSWPSKLNMGLVAAHRMNVVSYIRLLIMIY